MIILVNIWSMKNFKIFTLIFLSAVVAVLVVTGILTVRAEDIKPVESQRIEEKIEAAVQVQKQAGKNIAKNLENLEKLIAKKNLIGLQAESKELERNYKKTIEGLENTRKFLEEKKISQKILERLDIYQKEYEGSVGKIIKGLSGAKGLENYQRQLSAIAKINKKNQELSKETIKNLKPFRTTEEGKVITKRAPATELSPEKLQYPEIKKIEIKKNKGQQESSSSQNNSGGAALLVFAGLSSSPSDYLGETEEIRFTQSIKELADSLGKDPLKILNYVKNNIDYVPYYGLKKGADATLIEKAGNDFDQSALLIALLRYSGYPAKYKHGQIKLSLNQVMNLLGVNDPIVAAKLLSQTHIPYVLYTGSAGEPLFFSIEHIWVEAYITYDYTRGVNQNTNPADKMWIPMEPSLKTVYYSQLVDIIDEMGFNVSNFYENYLQGSYGQQKPIAVYRQEIENYLSANHPDLTYEDILTKSYEQKENLEFIPNTLPYEIVENFDEYSQAPENLKHKIQFRIADKETSAELLNYTAKIHNIADKQIVLTYVAASPEDQQVIDQYSSIYDIMPLSLVHMKPVIKVNGEVVAGAAAGAPEIMLGKKEELTIKFLVPSKETGLLSEQIEDIIEKEAIVGNDEGIAINTDRIVLPELRPAEDTQTIEFLSAQKLYRTALNFLDRLQQSHKELAESLGGEFTNAATRAIVFNGIDVNYQAGQPYSFTWKGLRIDSSSLITYFSHFGNDIKRNKTRFMYLFGLAASLDESSIFEEDFNIEAMSTVKGLKMLNQGQIPGTSVVKITSANRSVIDTLNVSSATKQKFKTSVDAGNIIYTASQQYAYGNFTGLVYIDLNPVIGDAGYIIGEGLNGGYTVEQWPDGWQNFWRTRLIQNLTATIAAPTPNQQFTQGQAILWKAYYQGTVLTFPVQWTEEKNLDTSNWKTGNHILRTGYGTSNSVTIIIKGGTKPTQLTCFSELEGRILPAASGQTSKEMHLPLHINFSSGVYQQRLNNQVQYNEQDDIYSHPTSFADFFRNLTTPAETIYNINNPWIDPKTGKYWDMSITFGAFDKGAGEKDLEKYYMNMRWDYGESKRWWFGKKIWIKNPATRKAIVAGILDYGPHETTGSVAGASPEALKFIGASQGSNLEFCWADQDSAYGSVINY